MKNILSDNFHVVDSLAEPVGELWKNLQAKYTKEGEFYVASPLSNTPLPIYQWIIDHLREFENWDKMNFVLMDELVESKGSLYEYISSRNPASYERFAREKFLTPLRKKTAISRNSVLKPDLNRINKFTVPIHLLILALGIKGNYANVMPGTSLETGWHIDRLLPEFQKVHTQKGSAYGGAHFTTFGMTLGPRQVLSAENVVVIISGENKKQLANELFSYTSFYPHFPLSIINYPSIINKVQLYIMKDALPD